MVSTEGAVRTMTFSWTDPAQVAAVAIGLDGIDYIKGLMNGTVPGPPVAALFDYQIVEAEVGRVAFHYTPTEMHYNSLGMVHGGVICTILDTVVGCAAQSTLPAGHLYTSVDLSVQYLAAVRAGRGPLVALGTVRKKGSRVIFTEGQLTDAAGNVLAKATSSLLVNPPRV
jgi:uncharacterized protein (TIGR00369 family)